MTVSNTGFTVRLTFLLNLEQDSRNTQTNDKYQIKEFEKFSML